MNHCYERSQNSQYKKRMISHPSFFLLPSSNNQFVKKIFTQNFIKFLFLQVQYAAQDIDYKSLKKVAECWF